MAYLREGQRLQQTTTMTSFDAVLNVDTYLTGIAKSGRVLYAFTEFYCYFHRLAPAFVFEHFAVFGCISAAVYSIDESVEREASARHALRVDDLARLVAERIDVDQFVSALLADAREYWTFEADVKGARTTYDLAHALRITEIRSFDFRMMHHALLQKAGVPYDQDVFDWFRLFEMLMEIEDDLSSIQQDEEQGGYNYYCFVRRLVGRDRADIVVEAVRADLEAQIIRRGALLWERGYLRCAAVFERYRAIVARRPIGVHDT